jgi:cytochrome c biogenesis protein CcmG, thiol:disulfide interchange protein DsbE
MATRDAAAANRSAAAQRAAHPDKSGSRLPIILAVVVALCAAVAVAVSVASDDDKGLSGPPIEDEAEDVRVNGAPLDAFLDGTDDLAVGKQMPELSGTGIDGRSLTVGGDGPALIVYLAHWCPVCQEEVPVIVDWLESGGGEGVQMHAVSTAFSPERGNWPSSTWLADEGWPVPTLLDPSGMASQASGQGNFPFFIAVDGDGEVVARREGQLPSEQLDALASAATGG